MRRDGLLEGNERFLEQVVALGGLAQGIREFLGAFLVRSLPLDGVGGFGLPGVKIPERSSIEFRGDAGDDRPATLLQSLCLGGLELLGAPHHGAEGEAAEKVDVDAVAGASHCRTGVVVLRIQEVHVVALGDIPKTQALAGEFLE